MVKAVAWPTIFYVGPGVGPGEVVKTPALARACAQVKWLKLLPGPPYSKLARARALKKWLKLLRWPGRVPR